MFVLFKKVNFNAIRMYFHHVKSTQSVTADYDSWKDDSLSSCLYVKQSDKTLRLKKKFANNFQEKEKQAFNLTVVLYLTNGRVCTKRAQIRVNN